jgi:hypothetical protein
MFISKVGRPFKVAKEMHLVTIQALIDIYSKMDPFLHIYLHPQICAFLQKNHSQLSYQILCLTIFHGASNIIRAYPSLGHHILALELDMEVFMEVLEPLVEIATPELDVEHVHRFNIDFVIKKHSRRLFDYE